MYRPVDAVEVRIWGRRAGAVALDPRLGFYAFEYDPRFVASGIQLAPIKMPLGRDAYAFPELPERSYHRLPALVADALPDRFGNALITAYLQREGVRERDITPLDRLAYMGKRAFGALEFRPDRGPRGEKPTALEMSDLVEAARKAVIGRFDSDAAGEAALVSLIRVGTSAGGARAKAAVGWNPLTGEIRAGQFDLPDGFEHWLLKFDGLGDDFELGVSSHYGRVELAYSRMARAAGFVVPDCRVYEEGGRAHFMVRRFDRDGNRKHHVQTLCALAHLDFNQLAAHDYAQWFMAALDLGIGEDEALRQMLARAAFNVMAANCDDHTKNLSFLMREGGRWELAPAYDLTHAFNPGGAWTYQHLMSVNGRFSGITRRDLLELADRFGVPGAREVLDRVASAVAGWPAHAGEAGLPPDDTQRVGADLRPGLTD
jgi:serine/threonine-protein kinase HipA